MNKLPYLNLGCGSTYDERWTNVDIESTGPGVVAHDFRLGNLPFDTASFEVVYHSHVLEHLPKEAAPRFLAECRRVLKSRGVIRIAIPDLEGIAANYLRSLHDALAGRPGSDAEYDWSVLELLDQLVRTRSGGEMATHVASVVAADHEQFLLDRCGMEMRHLMDAVRGVAQGATEPRRATVLERATSKVRRESEKAMLGRDYALLQEARFRNRGEVHRWMYDRYSLKRLLHAAGFADVVQRSAFESAVPGWCVFRLDGENGSVRKPDSLFMEAVKDA